MDGDTPTSARGDGAGGRSMRWHGDGRVLRADHGRDAGPARGLRGRAGRVGRHRRLRVRGRQRRSLRLQPPVAPRPDRRAAAAACCRACGRRACSRPTAAWWRRASPCCSTASPTSWSPPGGGQPYYDIRGERLGDGLSLTWRDVTDRHLASEALQAQRDLAVALSAASDLEQALELVMEAALALDGVDAGGVYLVDPETGALQLAIHSGLSPEFISAVSAHRGRRTADAPADGGRLRVRGAPRTPGGARHAT